MMRIDIGYPDPVEEKILLTRQDPRVILPALVPLMSAQQVSVLQDHAASVHTSNALVD